ncbi:hypothetical protein TIFTF001_019589 [Ficus carica]|uniref:Uncharacterized protein n=1 Tax=Ficus carica TaxID=3494 RepID=A0AA88AQN6_FICCA|nr:hypothetical protein TIFTF001_019589 [Ficus carica]
MFSKAKDHECFDFSPSLPMQTVEFLASNRRVLTFALTTLQALQDFMKRMELFPVEIAPFQQFHQW